MRILLVEDHDDTRYVLQRLLTRANHVVTLAATLAEAKQLCTPGQFDLVLADLGLPDGEGLDMGQITLQCGVKAIALTGYGSDSDIEKSQQAGFVAHVVKPISFAQLEETIERVIASTGFTTREHPHIPRR